MPIISRFLGITIKMYFGDHSPPHFHAEYQGYRAVFEILTLGVIAGELPPRIRGAVVTWATRNQKALYENWELCQNDEQPRKIRPL